MSDLPNHVGWLEEDARELRTDMRAVRSDLGEIKETLAKMESRLEARITAAEARLDGRIGAIEGRLDGRIGAVEGRLAGIEGRFAHIPSTLQLLGFALAVLIAGGILRYLEPRFAPSPVTTPPAITNPAR